MLGVTCEGKLHSRACNWGIELVEHLLPAVAPKWYVCAWIIIGIGAALIALGLLMSLPSPFDGDAHMAAALGQTIAITTAVLTGLIGFSAIIAAVGTANTLSLNVLQRTRRALT